MGDPNIKRLILKVLKDAKISDEGPLSEAEIKDRVRKELRRERMR